MMLSWQRSCPIKALTNRVILFTSFFVFASGPARGAELLERTIEVSVQESNPNTASRILLEQATQRVSEDLIRETIGPAKYQRNQALVQTKVLKQSARFVPLAKPGDLIPDDKGFKMSVLLKVNPDELQQVLLENGLFYDSDVAPLILPAVQFRDNIKGQNYSWWEGSQNGLSKWSRDFEVKLRSSFWKNGFYVLRPQGYRFQEIFAIDFSLASIAIEKQPKFCGSSANL